MNKLEIIFYLIAPVMLAGCNHVDDNAAIYQWRGAERNGIYQETGLLEQWPEDGPALVWVYEGIGRGFAAPAVSEDRIFINGELEGKSILFAFDLEGNLQWKSPNGDEFLGEGFSSTYPGARSTPTVLGGMVYATSGQGRIACFEASTGAEKWAVSITDDLGGRVGEFGYSESVAVDQNNVYCFPGGSETNMAALDRYTGKTTWTSELLRDTFAYGSPVLAELPDAEILITTSRHSIISVDRKDGTLLGSYPVEGYEYDGEHCNTPVFNNGSIYFAGNDEPGQGAIRLQLSQDGKQFREIWRNPAIKNNFGGLVVVNDHLFTTIRGNRLVSLDPENGTLADSIKVATGSLVFADNKFFCYGNNGTIHLVSYQDDRLEIAGVLKVTQGTGHHFAHPVLSNGTMYIRHGDALMAYRVK